MAQQIDIVANLLMKVDGAEAGINKLKSSLSKLKMPEGLENSFKKSFANLDTIFAKYRSQVEKGFETKSDVSAFNKTSKALDAELTRLSKHFTELTGKEINFKVKSDDIIQAEKKLEQLVEEKNRLGKESLKFEIKGGKDSFKDIETLLQKLKEVAGKTKTGENISGALDFLKTGNVQSAISLLEKASASVKRFKQDKQDAFKNDTGFDMSSILATIISMLNGTEGKFSDVNAKITETKNNLANFQAKQIQDAGDYAEKLANDFSRDETAIRQANGAMQDFARSSQSMSQQLGDLQQSTQYFFSLRNMINLLKRGIDQAIDTVKELDAAMTQTAVVTDFDVSDMWEKLPEYTANANALGATVKDMYEATTLYYQQGLNTEAAMGIANETMKMARIGGLEAADATDKMTAALRGFNMELNETSAQRVNDVYSNLAAKTASDTEELGTAMQRTASIAASAGMSFEGTAAFLAQAIETTREPAENLGTAMKTIVARFTELKKNPLEIAEVDGEEVDYNKVDTALKSIGVSLKDANGQFRNLDQVFLDISQRWDSLTQTQQRYVATTAAGSRQQSRFIAMMSNYERTVQLMDYANNSAGASNEQFGKTMESLEAKLNKLKNAWDQFLMGITNSSFIKTAVDGLTSVLGVINKLIDTLSLGSGAIKSGLSIFAAFNGLKASGRIANSVIGGLGGMLDPTSTFSAGFSKGMINTRGEGNAKLASQIYTPIVAAIRDLKNTEQQKNNQSNRDNPYDQYNRFKDARANLFALGAKGKTYNLKDVQGQLNNLDANSQNILMRGVAGTTYNLRNAVLDTYYKQLFGKNSAKSSIKEAERYLNNQRQLGKLTWEEYFSHISDPNLMRKALNSNHAGTQAADELLQKMSSEIQQKANLYAKEEANRLYEQFAEQGYEVDTPEIQKAIKEAEDQARQRAMDEYLESIQGTNGKAAALFNTIGKLGSGFSQVGMGLQTFGNILSSSANPAIATFGAALSSFGGIISGLGMGISGLINGFTTIASSGAMTSLSTALTGTAAAAGTLTGVIGIVVAALGGLAFYLKKRSDGIKKIGEDARNDYTTKKSETESNISNLESIRAEFASLSEGVDRLGNNVTLDSSDYARYREIVGQIAEINPSIVEGFNAQGDAIINNNQALEETLALQKQIQKENIRQYTSTATLQTLINARNQEKAFKNKTFDISKYDSKALPTTTDIATSGQAYFRALTKNLSSKELKKLGIDSSQASIEQISVLKNNMDSVQKLVDAYAKTGRISDKEAGKILDRATTFKQAIEEVETASLPIYESLSEYATLNKLMSNIPEEMYGAYQNGLKDIAAMPLDASEMHRQAEDLATAYSDIFSDPRYTKAIDGIKQATEDYSDTLDEVTYNTAINGEEIKGNLENYISELENNGDAVSLIAAQHLQTILSKAQNMQEIAGNLGEAFDTMAKHIDQLKETANNFSEKAEEIDPQAGAKAIKGIYDTIFGEDSTHALGEGDAVYWSGAQAVIDDEIFRKGNKEQIDAIFKKLEPTLEEGIDGIIATEDFFRNNPFKDLIIANPEGGITSNITTSEELAAAAEHYGVTTDVLAAMLKRLDQFGLDFIDYDSLRTNYASSDQKVVGDKTTEIEGQVGVLVDEQQVLNDAIANGQSPQDFYKEGGIKDTLQKEQNIDMLPKFIEGSSKEAKENHQQLQSLFKKYNINDQNYVEQLKLLGRTQDEIETIASSGLIKGANKEEVAERFENAPGAEDDKYASETVSKLGELVSLVSSITDHFGIETDTTGITTGEATKADFLSNDFEVAASEAMQNYLSGKTLNGDVFQNAYDKKQTEKEIKDNLISPLNAYKEQLEKGKKEAEENAKAHPGDESAELKVNNYEAELGKVNSMLSALQSMVNPSSPLFNNAGMEAYYGTNIGKTLSTVDPSVIAENQEAFSNIFNDIVTGVLPSEADLQSLGILEAYKLAGGKILEEAEKGVEDSATEKTSNASEQQIRDGLADAMSMNGLPVPTGRNAYGIHEKVQTFLTNLYSDFAEADKAALAMDAVPSSDNISKAIQNVGQKLKNWYDKIHGIDQDNQKQPSSNATSRSIPTSTTPQPQISTQPQEQNIVFHANTSELDSAKNTIQNLFNLTNQPVSFIVNTALQGSTSDILAKINEVKEATKKKNTIKVGTKITGQEGIKNLSTIINQVKPKTVKVSASVSGANLVSSLASKISALKDKVVNITTKHKSIGNDGGGGANGINNHIPITRVPSFGSLAKGTKSKHGQVGPRNRGGLTLTGEKGFEIAWLPSENRSMILGTEGPQMLNLPSDAVVYTHEQSKKIIKQRGIPAGSHADVAKGSTNVRASLGSSLGTTYTQTLVNNAKKAGDKVAKEAENTSKAIARVTVWWENAARRAEAIQRKTDKNQDAYEKYLKDIKATLNTTGTTGQGNAFIINNQQYISEQQLQYEKARNELKQLNSGKWQSGKKKGKSATSKKTKTKKKNQKAYEQGADNIIQVSYKSGKKDKTDYVNTKSYIKWDAASGSYQIDQKKLNKIKNKEKRKQVAEQLNKEINDRISKKNAAEDNIKKAQEALEKFSQELYDTFFAWEIELTKIQNITQKIEALNSKISRKNAIEELINAQAKANNTTINGKTLKTITPEEAASQLLQNFNNRLTKQQEVIIKRRQAIDQSRLDLQNKATGKNISNAIATVTKNLNAATNETDKAGFQKALDELKDQQKVFTEAQKYVTYSRNLADGTYNVDFNTAEFEKAQLAGLISADMGKAIQDFVKELEEGSKELDDLIQSQTEGLTELYNTLNDLNDQWADYEKQLIEINEEANKKELDQIKKLSDSLKKSMDELLDAVKKRLDERRKQEDNLKTEQDISQKQQRLAMLRADTAGGHQVEIAQLEKEIADAQQNYQRSLEDQLLEKLQNQADEASKQRERQIELQEGIATSVNNIEEVQKWMAAPEQYKNELWERYKKYREYDNNKGPAQQAEIAADFTELYTGLINNREEAKSIADAIDKDLAKQANQIKTEEQQSNSIIESKPPAMSAPATPTPTPTPQPVVDPATLKKQQEQEAKTKTNSLSSRLAVAQNQYQIAQATGNANKISTAAFHLRAIQNEIKSMAVNNDADKYYRFLLARGDARDTGDDNWGKIGKDGFNNMLKWGSNIGKTKKDVILDLVNTNALTWKKIVQAAFNAGWSTNDWLSIRNSLTKNTTKNNLGAAVNEVYGLPKKNKQGKITTKAFKTTFKTGGIADFTGPAWLDGTPSKPELVLNATDTKNFLALKDILSKAMSSTSSISNDYEGDIMYEININVDKIEKDYDVDRVVEKVKKEITKGAGYRNVTQVRNFR